MKKKIAILGSTGSIGRSILNIISRDNGNFNVLLLTADSNYKKLFQQAKIFKVKNLIITNKESFKKASKKKEAKRLNIYNSFKDLEKILNNKKLDYLMSSISGIEGLKPTLSTIHLTKRIAIANKEAIICGWNLINKTY